ncbi:MAG: hypothetical protein JWO62_2936 [Acidimicrobiaceae bacterium]|nr:hypothetical protein [Acidimicrobiaceae bacterium]
MLAGLTELYALAPLEEFPNRVLSLVHSVIGCDAASYNEIAVSTGHFRVLIDPAGALDGESSQAFERFVHEHPVIAHVEATGDSRARTISDFLSPVQFRRLGLYCEFFGPLGFEDQLSTSLLAARGEQILGVALNRSGQFSESDRLLLDTLRPHLVCAHQNAMDYSRIFGGRITDEASATRAAAALERLTDRQREVLRLVAEGHTNVQIAVVLEISVGTVKKHIEHIFERLEAQSRVSAARVYLAGVHSTGVAPWWNLDGDAHRHFVTSRS